MTYHKILRHKILLSTIAIACLALVLPSSAKDPLLVDSYRPGSDLSFIGDYLDPSFVGESMSMPLPIEFLQEARDAGIIKGSNPLDQSLASDTGSYPETSDSDLSSSERSLSGPVPAEASSGASQIVSDVNVTGPWSVDLGGQKSRHLDLTLTQNRDTVMGYGAMTSGNDTIRVTASGSIDGSNLNLAVMPADSLDVYKLSLSLNSHTTGTYTAYSAGGETWSGDVTGTASLSVSVPSPSTDIAPSGTISSNTVSPSAVSAGPVSTGAVSPSIAGVIS